MEQFVCRDLLGYTVLYLIQYPEQYRTVMLTVSITDTVISPTKCTSTVYQDDEIENKTIKDYRYRLW